MVHLHLIHPVTVPSTKYVSGLVDLENSDVSTVSVDTSAFSMPSTIGGVGIKYRATT